MLSSKSRGTSSSDYVEISLPKLSFFKHFFTSSSLNPLTLLLLLLLLIFAYLLGSMATEVQYLKKGAISLAPSPTLGQTSQSGFGLAIPTLAPKVNVDNGTLPILGDKNAKVQIVEFADYQCPYCEQFFTNIEPQIIKNYVDTGKASFAFRNYAFLDERASNPNSTNAESTWSAEAADCANEQGRFWDFHDYLYSHQGPEDSGAFAKDKLEGFAQVLGLNTDQFNSCLESDKYAQTVADDMTQGKKFGVTSTPTTFINGQAIVGALPDQIMTAIEAAASK